ncbi:MAG: OB-fold domain-containing protein [Elusimicrobia bacterium]|nr:OB-fold domain-containing protein [Elusimicrobiota bacterium]
MNPAAGDEILVHESRIQVPYRWSAGILGTRFFIALKERKFLATRCPACEKVYLPPVQHCGNCFAACEDRGGIGPQGSLVSFTQALYKSPAQPERNPLYGLIRLDGADTALLHLLGEASLNELKIGLRVEAVFAERPSGGLFDLRYFRPVR